MQNRKSESKNDNNTKKVITRSSSTSLTLRRLIPLTLPLAAQAYIDCYPEDDAHSTTHIEFTLPSETGTPIIYMLKPDTIFKGDSCKALVNMLATHACGIQETTHLADLPHSLARWCFNNINWMYQLTSNSKEATKASQCVMLEFTKILNKNGYMLEQCPVPENKNDPKFVKQLMGGLGGVIGLALLLMLLGGYLYEHRKSKKINAPDNDTDLEAALLPKKYKM